MWFPSFFSTLVLMLALRGGNTAASDDKLKPVLDPCTISSSSGSFFDLRPLSIHSLPEGKKPAKNQKVDGWHAKGYDYKANFTLNICEPVVEKLVNVQGVEKSRWKNISAFYEVGSKQFSLGQQSSDLTLRGRRLVLQYTNGSPCNTGNRRLRREAVETWGEDEYGEDEGEEELEDEEDEIVLRKSSIISFHCDKDPLAIAATVTYAGVDPYECAYHFEVLSPAACGGSEPAKQGVGPAAVFAIIGVIAILVYFLGGVFYQRNVAHARGWRQLPNYSFWAGIGSFVKDFFVIATSSCAHFFPSRRGYSALSISANGGSNARGRHNGPEDENRLIDQLDEEWDD